MKVAISLPDDVLERLDAAAARAGLNRSEFFRTAGVRFAIEVEGGDLTHAIDAHLASLGPEATRREAAELAEVLDYGRATLVRRTDGEDW